MSGESNADVYASFGVNSAVMSGSTQEDHEQNMLALDVAARDGDDSIELVDDSRDDPYASGRDPFADPNEEDPEGRIQVRIGSDESDSDVEITNEGAELEEGQEVDSEFTPLTDTPEELTDASSQLAQHEEGFQEMIDAAATNGLTEESIVRIQQEYAEEGISEQSYAELAAAGYSRSFVDSYIRGQEALVESYVKQVKDFAGGEEKFHAVLGHLETTNAEAAESLMNALEARDLGTVKAILNLAGQSYSKKFGKPAARTLTTQSTPAKPQGRAKNGFESQAEMIKAMSDSRYRTDGKYRREVEQRVIDSSF
ncbi:putative capsid assembly scaffolding protein [Erwinia phage pEp_SNUABM_10]|nr:putative capsid assembly scaffolding protein [Erwinia phage pEp_SNUABM_03]QOC57674.1 putative capsid assembly scaffolding protein [Erwinia phage pEp_SNUABM_04]QOC57724.1 putative capsid assembly scaffolding protein [Erwinia phage pEp_SNUABM_10]QOC57777.1 putative capsid assembly scaffolding protein [Erwinia phage pEp_SNUABM_11]